MRIIGSGVQGIKKATPPSRIISMNAELVAVTAEYQDKEGRQDTGVAHHTPN